MRNKIRSYKKDILSKLISSYRKSKKSTGKNKVTVRTRLKPDKLYKLYYSNKSDVNELAELNGAIKELANEGYLSYECDRDFPAIITSIILSDSAIPQIESYLQSEFGISSAGAQEDIYRDLIAGYKDAGKFCAYECEKIEKQLPRLCCSLGSAEKDRAEFEKREKILKALAFIEKNYEYLYLREASMLIFGASHALDPGNSEFGYILEAVCRIIREVLDKPIGDEEKLDDILSEFHIIKEPDSIEIKGPARLIVKGKEIDISLLVGGIEFYDIHDIDKIIIDCNKLISVENKVSFNRMPFDDAVIFYLGGFSNRFQAEFLRKVYEDNPNIEYLHFGDIDVNGFWIHHDLCKVTGIKFGIMNMGVEELTYPMYESCLQPLTDNDLSRITKLHKLEEFPLYKDTVEYMEEHKVKLEQEIISLRERI